MKYAAFMLAAALSLGSGVAAAETYTVGMIEISNPWARATPKGATIGGGYMTITNKGTDADRLTGGSTPVANQMEVHQMTMDKGVMTMRPVEGGLEIKPGETVTFKPSGYHLMFTGLKSQLTKGEHVDATLKFEKAGEVKVQFDVAGIGAMSADGSKPAGEGGGHDMPGMKMNH